MMKNKIVTVKNYVCGYEKFDFHRLFLNSESKTERLPINVFMVEHRQFGCLLIDTGCGSAMKRNPIQYALYKKQHAVEFTQEQSIVAQLKSEELDTVAVKKVLLSHAELSCCGELPAFEQSEVLSTAQVLDNLPNKLIPPRKRAVGVYESDIFLKKYFKWNYDVLGDGSIIAVDIGGHSKAMVGFYLPEHQILFMADAAIDERVLSKEWVPSPKLLSYQYDADRYLSVLANLRHLYKEHREVKIIFQHSQCPSVLVEYGQRSVTNE